MKLSELIDILTETLSINGEMDVVGMVDGNAYSVIEINCPDDESPAYIELYKSDGFTAYYYMDSNLHIVWDFSTYDNKEEAIEFAKGHNWDEVKSDKTGEIVWRRESK